MTYSSDVREEVAHQPVGRACCRTAYLAAVLRGAGSLHLTGRGHAHAEIDVGSHAVARQVLTALREEGVMCGLRPYTPERLGQHQRVLLVLAEDAASRSLLVRTGVVDEDGRPRLDADPRIAGQPCCRVALLRGAFAAGGSVAAPGRAAHLELRTHGAAFGEILAAAAARLGIPMRVRVRVRWTEVATRRRSAVQELLTVLGADGAALGAAEDDVVRSARGEANRRANFDTANLARQVRAARAQLAAIASLEADGRLAGLPAPLREAARLRAEGPELTLAELAAAAGVGRPTMAGRLRRLVDLGGVVEVTVGARRPSA